jgi:signal transduction histidine kinase
MAFFRRLLAAALACALLVLAAPAMAGPRVQVDALEDPSRAMTYPEVQRARFAAVERSNVGYSSSAFWLRVRVETDAEAPTSWILELVRFPDRAELYDGATVRRSGSLVPFSERDVHSNDVAFRLELPPRGDRTVYLRLESTDSIALAVELSDASAFAESEHRQNLFTGAYYGLLLGIIVYNLFLYVSTRDRSYLLYVLFQTSFLLVQTSMNRFGFEYLWPGSTWFAQRSDEVTAGVAMFAATRFAAAYLETRQGWPTLHRAIAAIGAGSLVLSAVALVRDDDLVKLALMVSFLAMVMSLVLAGVLATRSGVPNGPYFLAAWTVLIACATVYVVGAVGALQIAGSLADAALKVGSAAEATLLSLGLGNRLRLLRDGERRAQALLLAEREEHARMLEARVEERTGELRAAQDLLVRQERLATLGRLAAGVGHEVGNPLNFVAGGAGELDLALGRLEKGEGGALADARRALKLVASGSDRIKKVVTNLRRYVASDDVAREPTDLVAELGATLDLTADMCARGGVNVVRELEPLPRIATRPGELAQVFMNIVLNACNAMTSGGTLTVSTRLAEGKAEIRFADDGPGVPPTMREVVFEAFSKKGSGSGLGLFVSREIAARHGGELAYEDNGAGATFVVRLPIA